MRKTFNISVPEEMYLYILKRSDSFSFCTVSEYIRSLVRKDQREQAKPLEPIKIRKANDCMADVLREQRLARARRSR